MAKKRKANILGYLYLVGLALVVIGFFCPMFKAGPIEPNGWDFLNFENFGFVTVGGLLILVGAAAGIGVSMVGGMVGAAVATEAYKSAVRIAAPGAEKLADKAKETAMKTVELAKEAMPDRAGDVVDAWNNFWKESVSFNTDELPRGGLIVNDTSSAISDLLKQTDRGLILGV
jgi:hypothetical protein